MQVQHDLRGAEAQSITLLLISAQRLPPFCAFYSLAIRENCSFWVSFNFLVGLRPWLKTLTTNNTLSTVPELYHILRHHHSLSN